MKRFRLLVISSAALWLAYSVDVNGVFADVDVEGLYKTVCELCHGPDGKGSTQGKKFKAPDFTDKEWQAGVTDEELIKKMTEGSADNEHYKDGVIPLLELVGVEDPASIVPAFIPKVRAFAK